MRIKHLKVSPEVAQRLRELGFFEQQHIKLLSEQDNFICQVCNARFGISEALAANIYVEPAHAPAAERAHAV